MRRTGFFELSLPCGLGKSRLTQVCDAFEKVTIMSRQISEQYCRSVLHVEVPVVVTLASKRMPIDQVLKLVPGVMIQFEKSCDSPMVLELAGTPIAQGEVVKIGDKFGIRISEISRPAERFINVEKLQ